MTLDEALSRPTISIPDAGLLFFGMKRSAAYEAAKQGDIPTIKVGNRTLVPMVPLAEKVGLKVRFGQAA